MGLDCYIMKEVATDTEKKDQVEIWYGRKENAIHNWMQQHSDIEPMDFNCERLYLTKELVTEFEADLAKGSVESTVGFFFGSEQEQEEIRMVGAELIKATKAALYDGEQPYYFSWW